MDKVQEAQEWLAAIKADVTRAKDSLATVAADGESVSDILRHDKGHDDWHASHGDPPCKSEEDCAAMSAKYKDEEAAKGGPGSGPHAGGSGGGAESARTARTVGQMRDAISHHESRQEMHRKAADALRAANPVRGERSAQKHDEAAYQHKIAAENFRDVVSNLYPSVVISHDDARFASGRAEAATREASGA